MYGGGNVQQKKPLRAASCVTKERSSHLSPVLVYDFLSPCKFRTLTRTSLYSSTLDAQNPVLEVIHQQSVNVYLHVQQECSAEPSVRSILFH